MEQLLYWTVLAVGLGLCLWLIRCTWPGWMAMPFVVLVIQTTRDLGIGPLANDWLDATYPGTLVTRVSPEEVMPAAALILLSYFVVSGGMVCVRTLWPERVLPKDSISPAAPYSPVMIDRGWRVSVLFFCVGLLANLAIISFLLPGRGLLDLALRRAVYTDPEVLSISWYHYARILSLTMQYGALSMLLFSGGKTGRIRIGTLANLLFIAFQALFGGRGRVILATGAMILVYHYGVRRIKFRSLLGYVLASLVFLLFIQFVRFHVESIWEGLALLLQDILKSARLDQAAFALHFFPKIVSFTGPINMIGALMRFLPTVSIPGTSNMWITIVEIFHRGNNPQAGIGGENFATAAELYSWNGYWTVIAFGFFAGLIFGIIFEWQRRRPNNLFLKLIAILAIFEFLSIESRLPEGIGSLTYLLVPIALMAALIVRNHQGRQLFFALYFEFVALFVYISFRYASINLWFLNIELLKYAIIGGLPIIYALSLRALNSEHLVPQVSPILKREPFNKCN